MLWFQIREAHNYKVQNLEEKLSISFFGIIKAFIEEWPIIA